MKLLYGALVVLVIFGTIRAFHVMFADMRSMREHQERKIRQRDVRKILDRDPD